METVSTPNKKVLKNYIFNATYQILIIIIPLITTPYVSRVLLAEGVGKYSYSLSIITYFTMFAGLGFNTYGQREIAKYQGDSEKQSKTFVEIILCRFVTTILCCTLNIVLACLGLYGDYSTLMLIFSINIIAVAFDVSFYLQGNEKFAVITVINIAIKLIGVGAIFLFVKTQEDVWKYTLINALVVILSNMALWLCLPKYFKMPSFKSLCPSKHLLPTLALFIPTVVTSVYTVLDKTLIGLILNNDAENGYYEQAEKIVKMALTIITALGTVMIPRNSNEYKRGNIEAVKSNVYFAVKFVWTLGVPLMFGLIIVSDNMNLWFFGEGYEPVADMMKIFSPIILSLGLNNVFGMQYLIPIGKENVFTISVAVGAVCNFILNIILIYTIGTVGAIIASVAAETIIMIYQLIYARKVFSIKRILLCGWKNVIAGVLMFLVLYFVAGNWESSVINTLLIILIGCVIYFVLIIALRDEFIINLIKKLFSKIKKQNKEEE